VILTCSFLLCLTGRAERVPPKIAGSLAILRWLSGRV
jgi:hypothetical protein